MASKLSLPELDIRLSIAIIAVAVGFLGWIQYSWFKESAAVEIEGAYKSLEATIVQTISREYQRYTPLLADLRSIAAKPGIEDAEIRAELARAFDEFGPTGPEPLVSLVGFGSASDPAAARVLGADGTWKAAPEALPSLAPDIRNQLLDRLAPPADPSAFRNLQVVVVGDAGTQPKQFIFIPAGGSSMAFVELDSSGFLTAYVKPAVGAVLPGASIEWSNVDATLDRRDAQGSNEGSPPRPNFNPLTVLLGLEGSIPSFEIAVPIAIEGYFRRSDPGSRPPQGQTGGSQAVRATEPPQRAFFAAALGGPDLRGGLRTLFARIRVPRGSAIGSIGRKLSLDWLLGTLLLLGLGTAFAFAVFQKRRSDLLRRREREFVASVTHELRTPVTAIRSAAENMRRGLVGPDRVSAYGDMMHAQSIRLGSMIEEVLQFSQVEGGNARPPALSPVRKSDIDGDLRAPLEAIARNEGIAIEWDFGALPAEFLYDPDTLRLVLSNLVANALYHAYPGPEKGAVRVTGKARLPDEVLFFVEDDGRGIDKREASLVFDPFYRDEGARARHEKGSGLGLFIARRKARLLGGDLALESPYERADGAIRPGCRFTLALPLKEADDAR